MPDVRSGKGDLAALVEFLKGAALEFGELPLFAFVEGSLFSFRRSHRVRTALPIESVELAPETWEICIKAPGLQRANPIPNQATTVSVAAFVSALASAVEAQPGFKLVLSDVRPLSLEGLRSLASQSGSEYSGVPLDQLENEEMFARLDLPVSQLALSPDSKRSRAILRVSST